jgi:hypothetical protein
MKKIIDKIKLFQQKYTYLYNKIIKELKLLGFITDESFYKYFSKEYEDISINIMHDGFGMYPYHLTFNWVLSLIINYIETHTPELLELNTRDLSIKLRFIFSKIFNETEMKILRFYYKNVQNDFNSYGYCRSFTLYSYKKYL